MIGTPHALWHFTVKYIRGITNVVADASLVDLRVRRHTQLQPWSKTTTVSSPNYVLIIR